MFNLNTSFFTFDKSIQIIVTFLFVFFLNLILRYAIKLPKQINSTRNRTLLVLFQNSITVLVFLIGVLLILSIMNINITPFLASAGIIGIVVGLAAQSLIKDLLSGIVLITENTINLGDFVELGNHKGIVHKITLRTIILRDENGALRIIPTSQITSVVNISKSDASIILDFPFKPDSQIDQLLDLFKDEIKIFSQDKRFNMMQKKSPELKGIQDIEPGKMIIRVVLYSHSNDQWILKREFLYRIKKRLEKEKLYLA
jgi:moderate conductance mechanosensitive channel